MQRARNDARMVRLREDMLRAIQGAVELWSTDAAISEVRSRLAILVLALRMILSKITIGAQRPLQIDHGALCRCHAALIATSTPTRARMRCRAAPTHGSLARACKHAYYTARSTSAVYSVSTWGSLPGGACHRPRGGRRVTAGDSEHSRSRGYYGSGTPISF